VVTIAGRPGKQRSCAADANTRSVDKEIWLSAVASRSTAHSTTQLLMITLDLQAE
jgi:hypothetical protein